MDRQIRVGTSGWTYPHRENIFYPADWKKSRWLESNTKSFSPLRYQKEMATVVTLRVTQMQPSLACQISVIPSPPVEPQYIALSHSGSTRLINRQIRYKGKGICKNRCSFSGRSSLVTKQNSWRPGRGPSTSLIFVTSYILPRIGKYKT